MYEEIARRFNTNMELFKMGNGQPLEGERRLKITQSNKSCLEEAETIIKYVKLEAVKTFNKKDNTKKILTLY